MTKKRRVIIFFASALSIFLVLQVVGGLFYAAKPRNWKLVRVGMSREQVFALIGKPVADTAELKGQEFWREVALLNERTLGVQYTVPDINGDRKVHRAGERL